MEQYKVGDFTPEGYEVMAVNITPSYKLRRKIKITNPNLINCGEVAYYYSDQSYNWVELADGQHLKLFSNEFEFVKSFNSAQLFTLIEQQLVVGGFKKQPYKTAQMENTSVHYTKGHYLVYVHLYNNSVRFCMQHNKDEYLFEIWADKYSINKCFGDNECAAYFANFYKLSLDYVTSIQNS